MQARDIMTSEVATVSPETDIRDIATLLLRRRISAVPVVDSTNWIVGIVSEGDLIHQADKPCEKWPRSWWLAFLARPERRIKAFIEARGTRAEDIMTREVICVPDDASLHDIAELLEKHRIKRVPVRCGGRLVGIVSRANLLRGFVASGATAKTAPSADNHSVRQKVTAMLKDADPSSLDFVDVVVCDGVVHLWGAVRSDDEANAIRIAAEHVPSVQAVRSHIQIMPSPCASRLVAE
jgi:CBS domain-containing protein